MHALIWCACRAAKSTTNTSSVTASKGASSQATATVVVKRSYAHFEVFASVADCMTLAECVQQLVINPATSALAVGTSSMPSVTTFLRARPRLLVLSTGVHRWYQRLCHLRSCTACW